MAAGPNRYEALRETAREVEKRDAAPSQENNPPGATEQNVASEHPAQQAEPEPELIPPTRPTSLPRQSPGWAMEPDLISQVDSANKWHAFANDVAKEKFEAARQDAPAQEVAQSVAPPQTPLTEEPPKTYEDLKNQHAKIVDAQTQKDEPAKKPPLTFNWDRDQGLDHAR
jgi:hypothetical protein